MNYKELWHDETATIIKHNSPTAKAKINSSSFFFSPLPSYATSLNLVKFEDKKEFEHVHLWTSSSQTQQTKRGGKNLVKKKTTAFHFKFLIQTPNFNRAFTYSVELPVSQSAPPPARIKLQFSIKYLILSGN